MYSQNNEDDAYLKVFKDLSNGVLLEIGAYNDKTFSNSKALIDLGWNAYLVDASPFCITQLFDAYKGQDRVNIIQSLITETQKEGLTSFYDAPGSAVSSIHKEHTQKYFPDKEYVKKTSKEIFMPSISLDKLISFVKSKEGDIHFLSIDVEGFSAELAMHLNFDQIRPVCICIEHDNKEQMIMGKYGNLYNILLHNAENLLLIRK